jgi:HEAT repeat protein
MMLLFIVGGLAAFFGNRKKPFVAPLSTVEIEAEDDVAVLLKKLTDAHWQVRQLAVQKLGEIGDSAAIPGLLTALDDADNDVREAVVEALVSFEAVSGLIDALQHRSQNARRAAVMALGQLQDEAAIPGLIEMLQDVSAWVRIPAAEALGEMQADDAISALIDALQDSDARVQQAAVDALKSIGTDEALSAVDGL